MNNISDSSLIEIEYLYDKEKSRIRKSIFKPTILWSFLLFLLCSVLYVLTLSFIVFIVFGAIIYNLWFVILIVYSVKIAKLYYRVVVNELFSLVSKSFDIYNSINFTVPFKDRKTFKQSNILKGGATVHRYVANGISNDLNFDIKDTRYVVSTGNGAYNAFVGFLISVDKTINNEFQIRTNNKIANKNEYKNPKLIKEFFVYEKLDNNSKMYDYDNIILELNKIKNLYNSKDIYFSSTSTKVYLAIATKKFVPYRFSIKLDSINKDYNMLLQQYTTCQSFCEFVSERL